MAEAKPLSSSYEEYYSYDEESEEEDTDADREEQDRAKNRAKFRGADAGDNSDGGSSDRGDSPLKDARPKAQKLQRDAKAAREPKAKKRPEGSAVASRKKARLSCSEPDGAAVASKKKRRSCSQPSGAAVAAPSSRSAAVAEPSPRSAAKAGKTKRLSCSEPSGAAEVNEEEDEFYTRRGEYQNFGGIEEYHVRKFRARQKRKGNPDQRNRDIKVPLSSLMVSKDCAPKEIDKLLSEKNPHVCVIFVDMADDEQSRAYDHLCKLADEATEKRVSCSDSKTAKRVTCSDINSKKWDGPKKIVHRLGEATFGFVVIHNARISRAMYDDHQFSHTDSFDDLLRFGTLHVSLAPSKYDQSLDLQRNEQTLCIGITLVRRSACGNTWLEKSDAQKLARWTQKETHDMVIACTGKDRSGDGFRDFWQCFANKSKAKHGCPIYQPLNKKGSAVATTDSASDGGCKDITINASPQMVFLYGEVNKVNIPFEEDIEPEVTSCFVDVELLQCVVDTNEIPSWLPPLRTDLAHRQGLGEVSVKAIQWAKASDSVLPLDVYIDYPTKTIAKKDSDDKGKGTVTTPHTKQSIPTDNKGSDKRTPTQTSTPQPPPFPPPRTGSSTRPLARRARSPSPRRRSSAPSRQVQTQSQSPAGYRKVSIVSCSDARRRQKPSSDQATTPKYAAVATTNNVSRPVVRLNPNQQSKAAVLLPPRRRGSIGLDLPSSSSIAHEPPSSKPQAIVERAKKDRAKVVEKRAASGDKRAAGSDKRSHTENSNCGEDDDGDSPWEEDFEFEAKQQVETRMQVRRTRGRSRSPPRKVDHLRERPNFLSTQYRRPLDQHAKSYPWTLPSSISKSARADPPANAQLPIGGRVLRPVPPSAVATVIRNSPQAPQPYVVRGSTRTQFQ